MVDPAPKLNPDAQPWARAVDADRAKVKSDVQRLANNTSNNLKALNGTTGALAGQVQTIQEVVDGLQVVTSGLQTVVGNLQTVTNDLASTKQGIVIPAVITNSSQGFGIGTSPAVVLSSTVTVPAGASSALVTAGGGVTAHNNNSGLNASMSGYISIAGNANTTILQTTVIGPGDGNIALSHAANLTGLTPGQTFTITVYAYAVISFAADSRNRSIVSASILFLP